MNDRVGAHDVVVNEHVGEAELLHTLRVGTNRANVSADLRLREDHSNAHVDDASQSDGRRWSGCAVRSRGQRLPLAPRLWIEPEAESQPASSTRLSTTRCRALTPRERCPSLGYRC